MNCDRVRDLLSPHLDGVLAAEEGDAVRQHLAECPSCRERFECLDQVVSLIRGIQARGAPAGFHEEVLAALPSPAKTGGRIRRWIPAAAAAVLLLSFGYLGARQFLSPPGGPPVEVGLLGSEASRSSGRSAYEPDSGLVTRDAEAVPADASRPSSGPFADEESGLGAAAPSAPSAPAGVDGFAAPGALGESRVERGLEYVVRGGEPDATAGLILAELQNRRSRGARDAKDEYRERPAAASATPALLEQVVADDDGEPARLVLYLTAEEVEYILKLLARRNGNRKVFAQQGDAPAANPAAEDGDEAKGKSGGLAGAGPAPRPEIAGDDDPADSRRFRVELRFDRNR